MIFPSNRGICLVLNNLFRTVLFTSARKFDGTDNRWVIWKF